MAHFHRSRSNHALAVVTVAMLAYALVPACATNIQDTGPGATSGTSSRGAGGSGGSGQGGSGGAALPCSVDCTQIQAPQCQLARCNEQTTQCEIVDDADGSPCEDGVFCTAADTCQAGLCLAGVPNTCGMTAAACREITCNETAETCGQTQVANGSACQAGLCTSGATCSNGNCTGGTPTDCFFLPLPNECWVATCDPMDGLCKAMTGNTGAPCNDATDLCTVAKTCGSMGNCQGGTPKDCSFLTQGCTMGVCNTSNGICQPQAVMNGQPCNDLNACTMGEICTAMICGGGAPVTVCSLTADGCCPSNCNANNDLDCAIQPSCKAIKMAIPGSMNGTYSIDPDGPGPVQPFNVYCDMTTDGGGWTLITWTGDSLSFPEGVPYPGIAPCPGLNCLRGSGAAPPRPEMLIKAATAIAQAQSTTTKSSFGPMSSYEYVGKHVYSSLSGMLLNYGPNSCTALVTGTFTSLIGPNTYSGTTTYLAQALAYDFYDYSSDATGYIWNVGAPNTYCDGSGDMPGSWMGPGLGGFEYGPFLPFQDGSYSVWVK